MGYRNTRKIKKVESFSASFSGSFAEFTVSERLPKIFSDHFPGESYDSFVSEKSLRDVFWSDGNWIRSDLIDYRKVVENAIRNSEQAIGKKIPLTMRLKDFFSDAPFFEAEVVFYHVILAEKMYHKNAIDFFAKKKDSDFAGKQEEYRTELKTLFDGQIDYRKIKDEKERLHRQKLDLSQIFKFPLTGNTGDLSQLETLHPDSVKILIDEIDLCFSYLTKKQHKRFDIICDNSGAELFSDIYLASFMLIHEYAKKIVLHVKPYPYFVSDATMYDFGKLLSILTAKGENEKFFEFIQKGKLQVAANKFWTLPKTFKELPNIEGIRKSDLIIVKGDLNYRRLVEDKNWNSSDSFKKRCLIKKIPVIALRVLKSDVLVGLEPALESLAMAEDEKYKSDGKYGVIQTNLKSVAKRKQRRDKISKKKKLKITCGVSKNFFTKIYFLILLGVLILVIGTFIAIFLVIIFGKDKNFPCDKIDFSLIMMALTILFGGSIVLPKFLLEREVQNAVKQYADNTVEEKTKECIDLKIDEIRNDLLKTDAHLSRMIAFELVEKFPVWSVGWAFRSMKRYIDLNKESIGFSEYKDFIIFVRTGVIDGAKQHSFAIMNSKRKKDDCFINMLKNEALRAHETIWFRPALRAIKDIVDFEYACVYVKNIEEHKKLLKDICMSAGGFCKLLAYSVMLENRNHKNISTPSTTLSSSEWLLGEILEISKFGSKSKDEDARKDFKEKLERILSDLESLESLEAIKNDFNSCLFFEKEEKRGDKSK